jgi:type I restriction enzyme, S subunit
MSDKENLPKGWTIAKFEDLLDYIQPTNYIVKSTEYKETYKTPVLTAGKSFIKGYTNETDGIFNSLPTIIFDDFTTATQFVNFPFKVKSSAMKILQPTCDLVNIKLVYYLMQIQNIKGETHKRFWISEYSQLPVPVPPINEQKKLIDKIEEHFIILDKGIESLITTQKQLKIYRESVMKWAFEGRLTNSLMNEVKLGEHCNLITKGASPKWQGFNYINDATQLLFVTSENVRENYIDVSEPKYLSLGFNNIQKRSILQKEDVLFNLVGASIGRAAIFNLDKISNINQAVAIIRLKKSISNKYLSHFLNAEVAKQKYLGKVVDVARANLSLTDIANMDITLPMDNNDQDRIVKEIESRLSVCDKIEETIENSLLQAEALRLSIIKKAFEGKLVPQNPSDEHAEKLLERIRAAKGKAKPEKKEKLKAEKKIKSKLIKEKV